MKVLNHIAGSHCVVELSRDAYIDARKGHTTTEFGTAMPSGFTNIEVVIRGHVKRYESAADAEAPARVVQLMKEFA